MSTWIRVEDRLPQLGTGEYFFVFNANDLREPVITIAECFDTAWGPYWRDALDLECHEFKPTHWMPFKWPELPK